MVDREGMAVRPGHRKVSLPNAVSRVLAWELMEPNTWKKIKQAYAEALELDPLERAGYIDGLPSEIGPQVMRLFAADKGAGDFIEKPFLLEQDIGANDSEGLE